MNQLFDQYWRKWTLACAAGNLLGTGVAAVTAVGLYHWMGQPETPGQKFQVLLCMMLAGVLQGAVLGGFQWRVLRIKFQAMPASSWVGATVAVAVLGWLMGMIPALFFMGNQAVPPNPGYQEPALILIAMGALALGLIFGAIFGLVQWLVFQRYAKESVLWVTGNSLGWGLAMMIVFLTASLLDETTPPLLTIVSGLLGGLLGGLAIGAITGIYLKKIIASNP